MATTFMTLVGAEDKDHLLKEMDKLKRTNESLLSNKDTEVIVETFENIDDIQYNGNEILINVKISRKR